MRKITVYYDNSNYTLTWLRALVFAKKEFREAGYIIEFDSSLGFYPDRQRHFPPPNTVEEFHKLFSGKSLDIVFLAYHHSQSVGLGHMTPQDRVEVLKFLKTQCNEIIWLDTADSTGTCLFDVLPYVDKYLKKQLLKDVDRYRYPIWGGRPHCEYYHKRFGIEDEKLEHVTYMPADEQYLWKLGVSWNVGLGDLFGKTPVKAILYRRSYAPRTFIKPSSDRYYDIHYRGTQSDTVALFQRNMSIKLLSERKDIIKPDVTTKVKHSKYVEETMNSRCILSPFGWGEICTRDFEAFLYGCSMIKMDMSSLVTYPDIYIPNKTYISVDWDFANFNSVIDRIKSDRDFALYIANSGSEMYKEYMDDRAKRYEFANHIISQL